MTEINDKISNLSDSDKQLLKNHIGQAIANQKVVKPHVGVAIVGVAMNLPGQVSTLDEYWQLLNEKKSVIQKIPRSRFSWPSGTDREIQGIYSAGLIDDIDKFDPSFFRLPPVSAQSIDPQHRIMMELSWKLIENAGYKPSALANSKTGVFAGVCNYDYRDILINAQQANSANSAIGTFLSVLSNRLSYFYNFHGPSITIDTACSSSLVAIHYAKESILNGECDYALAGGVNLICTPTNSMAFAQAGMLSKKGKCRTFDSQADGYVRGEGAGLILLKNLAQAEKDQDHIYAVIKGSAINHGGKANSLTSPNPTAQAALISQALRNANCTAESISYIESHGTGTELGDPIEIEGLIKGFAQVQQQKPAKFSCAVGSVKPIIGHLESASGIAGLLKVLALLRYKTITGAVNFNKLNQHISLKKTPFYIAEKTQPWNTQQNQIRRAAISAFGFSGTNAHMVIEEYVAPEAQAPVAISTQSARFIIPLSARTEEQLQQRARDLLVFLQQPIDDGEAVADTSDDNNTAQSEQEEALNTQITHQLAKLLAVAPAQLDPEQALTDYGVDTLHLNQLFDNIATSEYGLAITLDAWLAQETIADLVDYALAHMPEETAESVASASATDQTIVKPKAKYKGLDLAAIAYTLQVGREGMEHRLGLMVNSIEQLADKLQAYIDGEETEERYQGRVKEHKDTLLLFSADADLQETVGKWIVNKKQNQLLALWVKGLDLDWDKLWDTKPQRISLPTYPFAKERYWIDSEPQVVSQRGQATNNCTAILHPLLHTNISDLSQQSYSTTFSGDEFFLEDHRVKGQKVLPGVAYLEMARAAVAQAMPDKLQQGTDTVLSLNNMVWVQPVIVTDHKQIKIALFANESGAIDYEVCSAQAPAVDGEQAPEAIQGTAQEIIHARGQAVFSVLNQQSRPEPLAMQELKAQMTAEQLSPDQLYNAYAQMGIAYGPAHRGVVAVYQGDQQLLAQLQLPDIVTDDQAHYQLHPSLLDSALQASIGLIADLDNPPSQPALPFALDKLTLFSSCTQDMYAWIRYSSDSQASDVVTKLDIDLLDNEGHLCVAFKSLKFSNDVAVLKDKNQLNDFEMLLESINESNPATVKVNETKSIKNNFEELLENIGYVT